MAKEQLPHDVAYKKFFKEKKMVESLLRDFVSADLIDELDFSTLERLPSTYETDDLRERRSDIVWSVQFRNGAYFYIILLIEFQSTIDHWMALRILIYVGLLLQDVVKVKNMKSNDILPSVLPIVLYNGSQKWNAPLNMKDLFSPMPDKFNQFHPQIEYLLIDEKQLAAEKLNNNDSICSLLFRLERSCNTNEFEQNISKLKTALQGDEYDTLKKTILEWLGYIINKMKIVHFIPEFHDFEEVKTMLEENVVKWRNDIFNEGKIKGEIEGEISATKINIINVLMARFNTIPGSVNDFISACDDLNTLRNLITPAASSKSIEDFIKVIYKSDTTDKADGMF